MNLTTMTPILSLTEENETDSDPEEEIKTVATDLTPQELQEVSIEEVEAEGVLKGIMMKNKMVI